MRPLFPKKLLLKWQDPKNLIQVFLGPRQVGKTTAALELAPKGSVFFSADAPSPPSADEIEIAWRAARDIPPEDRTLILDEVQKIPGWSEIVKRMWDEDRRLKIDLRVAILGSSALQIEKGLSESLTGRFEVNFFPHWTFGEVKKSFGASIEDYLLLGGYPKAYSMLDDRERALDYIDSGILEPTLGRDILALHSVDKPALLRQLFWYTSKRPAQIVSFQKILDHLQDRGNSATLSHYAELLKLAFIAVPVFKFTKQLHRTKRSLPKWIFPNPALVDAKLDRTGEARGFLIENLVGSHILNVSYGDRRRELQYWREDNREIDFIVLDSGRPVVALEVKSGRAKGGELESTLLRAGLNNCPGYFVTEENLTSFLNTTSVQEIASGEWETLIS